MATAFNSDVTLLDFKSAHIFGVQKERRCLTTSAAGSWAPIELAAIWLIMRTSESIELLMRQLKPKICGRHTDLLWRLE